jgi:integrase
VGRPAGRQEPLRRVGRHVVGDDREAGPIDATRLRTDAPRASDTTLLGPQSQLDRLVRSRVVVREFDARRGSSPKTVSETISVLSLIMQTAMRARVLREKPAAGHSIPHRRKRVRVLTMAEIDQLATHADERYRAAIWLLALTGVRTSERLGAARDGCRLGSGLRDRQRGADVGRWPARREGAEDRERRSHYSDPGMARRRPPGGSRPLRRASRRAGACDRSTVHVANGQADARPHPLARDQPSPGRRGAPEVPSVRPSATVTPRC